MTNLAEQWRDFEERVLPKQAGEVQRIETRRAFYAGAAAFLFCLSQNLTPGLGTTDADLLMMDSLSKELEQFKADLKGGVA